MQSVSPANILSKASRRPTPQVKELRIQNEALHGPDPLQLMFSLWAEHMARGEFSKAWDINDRYERHWPSAHVLHNASIRNARVTVRSLHGLGDAVQMLRYAPLLRSVSSSVSYQVPSPLLPLMPYFQGVETFGSLAVLGAQDSSSDTVHVEMMELPYIFRTSLDQLPLRHRYLNLPAPCTGRCGTASTATVEKRIGLVWAGGNWDVARWIPFHSLLTLLPDSRFEWWNLQGGDAANEADNFGLRFTAELRNGGVLALAQKIANMDLVITIDSLAAHLAGALGLPTWLLLKHNADWRWMGDRADSPWYPSMTLFRQDRPGDWDSVVAALKRRLNEVFKGSEQQACITQPSTNDLLSTPQNPIKW